MKLKISCTNGKKGAENAGLSINMEGNKQQVLDTLDIARKAIDATPE